MMRLLGLCQALAERLLLLLKLMLLKLLKMLLLLLNTVRRCCRHVIFTLLALTEQ